MRRRKVHTWTQWTFNIHPLCSHPLFVCVDTWAASLSPLSLLYHQYDAFIGIVENVHRISNYTVKHEGFIGIPLHMLCFLGLSFGLSKNKVEVPFGILYSKCTMGYIEGGVLLLGSMSAQSSWWCYRCGRSISFVVDFADFFLRV